MAHLDLVDQRETEKQKQHQDKIEKEKKARDKQLAAKVEKKQKEARDNLNDEIKVIKRLQAEMDHERKVAIEKKR